MRLVQLVPNSDSQISEVIIPIPSFTTFSSKMNVQTIILKEFSFLDVYDLIQLVPNSDSQISEVIILNPSFTTVSSKINVQIIILKEFSFLDVYVMSISGKHG